VSLIEPSHAAETGLALGVAPEPAVNVRLNPQAWGLVRCREMARGQSVNVFGAYFTLLCHELAELSSCVNCWSTAREPPSAGSRPEIMRGADGSVPSSHGG
jgi:hypothetical protein